MTQDVESSWWRIGVIYEVYVSIYMDRKEVIDPANLHLRSNEGVIIECKKKRS